ncbi:hypothetical protein RD792_002381 [Penstemon davidsonii]|uniref:Uncharacterized protein n=1 Tax=Penstemon davidsonii TaxID=160366 RepID=A0ABR0DQZ6_9LAMI|nr:hypothetical protein RD792_002381 [Penstemon davidsonii]
MADQISAGTQIGNQVMAVDITDDVLNLTMPGINASNNNNINEGSACSKYCFVNPPFIRKLIAEILGTYFLIFGGCAAVVLNAGEEKVVTLPGIALVWGLIVMVLIYAVGHISGAHFNPAVTIAFATCKRFPWKQVPAYILTQVLGSTLASGTLRLLFEKEHFFGTLPAGSNVQSLVVEFIITFLFMFVMSGVVTDTKAIGELAGLAIGATVLVNVIYAGPISGASMNPARSIGPAIVSSNYNGLWIYILGPISGAIGGAWTYNFIRTTDAPIIREITKSSSFLRSSPSPDGYQLLFQCDLQRRGETNETNQQQHLDNFFCSAFKSQ